MFTDWWNKGSKWYEVAFDNYRNPTINITGWDGEQNHDDVLLATVDRETRAVTYIDADAETDPQVKRTIDNMIDGLNDDDVDEFCDSMREIAKLKTQTFLAWRKEYPELSIKELKDKFIIHEYEHDWYKEYEENR